VSEFGTSVTKIKRQTRLGLNRYAQDVVFKAATDICRAEDPLCAPVWRPGRQSPNSFRHRRIKLMEFTPGNTKCLATSPAP